MRKRQPNDPVSEAAEKRKLGRELASRGITHDVFASPPPKERKPRQSQGPAVEAKKKKTIIQKIVAKKNPAPKKAAKKKGKK